MSIAALNTDRCHLKCALLLYCDWHTLKCTSSARFMSHVSISFLLRKKQFKTHVHLHQWCVILFTVFSQLKVWKNFLLLVCERRKWNYHSNNNYDFYLCAAFHTRTAAQSVLQWRHYMHQVFHMKKVIKRTKDILQNINVTRC